MKSEHEEQCDLIQWWRHSHPSQKKLLFAIPNGGKRSKAQAARFRAEGVVAGVPDLFLAIPTEAYAGLFIELKRAQRGIVSPPQRDMLALLDQSGYAAVVCRGAEQAKVIIERYLANEL